MTDPTTLIQFDRETLTPAAIFYNGVTDTETAKLRGIVDVMLKALLAREAAESSAHETLGDD